MNCILLANKINQPTILCRVDSHHHFFIVFHYILSYLRKKNTSILPEINAFRWTTTPPTLRYGGLGTYQQSASGSGGGGGGMKHHQPRGGNRSGRGSTTTHRQQRPAANSRYHPYPFRQPLPPQQQQQQQQQQQRSYRPPHPIPRTPAALMGKSN